MNIAIIPARGGSKRIPKKNIKAFMGKPIIAYSIEAAKQSQLFDEIMVSTDDDEIAEVAIRYGAKVPFVRPKDLADDFTGTTPVVQHATNWFIENYYQPDNVCCIYATAPFVEVKYLQQGLQKLNSIKQGMTYSLTSYGFPIQRAQKMDATGHPIAFNPELMSSRSQDLEPAFHDAGQFYWWTEQALKHGVKECLGVILPRYLVQDIDTIEDWRRAELMYQAMSFTQGQVPST